MSDPNHWLEVSDRWQLQVQGVKILFKYPFGLLPQNLTYMDVNREADVGVHNHYLSRGTRYGFLYAILLLGFLLSILIRSAKMISRYRYVSGRIRACAIGGGFALFGLLVPCAMTHHGGIVQNDAATIILLALVLAADMNYRRYVIPQKPRR
jgi:hypothetical protein